MISCQGQRVHVGERASDESVGLTSSLLMSECCHSQQALEAESYHS